MKKAFKLFVLYLLFFIIQGQHNFAQMTITSDSQSIAAANKKPTTYKHPVMTLLAGRGFYDGKNWVNMYASNLYFIHGKNSFGEDIGFFEIPFESSVPRFPHLGISLSHLTPGKAFTLRLRIWANLSKDYKDSCTFYVEKNNASSGVIAETLHFKEAHLPIQARELKDLDINIENGATQTGIYYINITGCYINTNLWYEISQITLTYD